MRRPALADLGRHATFFMVGSAEVTSTLRDGGTTLLHDSDCTSRPGSRRSTVAALPLLAAQLRARRWEVRTPGDHLGPPC